MKTSITIFLIIVCSKLAIAQSATNDTVPTVYSTLMINMNGLEDSERALILKSLSSITDSSKWATRRIVNGDNLYKIIDQEYDYYIKDYPASTDTLLTIIKRYNKLTSDILKINQKIILPNIPKRPHSRGANYDLAQFRDIVNSTSSVISTTAILIGDSLIASNNIHDEQEAGITIYANLSKDEVDLVHKLLPDSILSKLMYKQIYLGATTEMIELKVNSSIDGIEQNMESILNNIEQVSEIDINKAGNFYILDFFEPDGDNCAHGQTVHNVVIKALQENNASNLSGKIIDVELDFFANKQKALKICEDYLNNMGEPIRNNLNKTIKYLKNLNRPEKKAQIPLFYLQALYYTYLSDKNSCVISSSFQALGDGFRILPYNYFEESEVNVLTAVVDDNIFIEDSPQLEPSASFYEVSNKKGVILVGAQKSNGVFSGMSSSTGSGVSCLAIGNTIDCKNKTIFGTSFATPYIGTQLLIAKAFWKSKGLNIDAIEARTRLILSADLNPLYVGRFASGGIPNLKKLMMTKGVFGVNLEGKVINLELLGENTAIIKNEEGSLQSLTFTRGKLGFCGLYNVGNDYYLFSESKMMWEKVDLQSINIVIKYGEVQKTIDLTNFKDNFSQIFIF